MTKQRILKMALKRWLVKERGVGRSKLFVAVKGVERSCQRAAVRLLGRG